MGFRLDATSDTWIRCHSRRIDQVAPERVRVELEKLAACAGGGEGLARVQAIGLLDAWRRPAPVGEGAAAVKAAGGEALRQLTPAAAEAWGLNEDEVLTALPLARLATLLDAAS